MTYNVSSGTLNPTIPYHTLWVIQFLHRNGLACLRVSTCYGNVFAHTDILLATC